MIQVKVISISLIDSFEENSWLNTHLIYWILRLSSFPPTVSAAPNKRWTFSETFCLLKKQLNSHERILCNDIINNNFRTNSFFSSKNEINVYVLDYLMLSIFFVCLFALVVLRLSLLFCLYHFYTTVKLIQARVELFGKTLFITLYVFLSFFIFIRGNS